MLKAPGAERCQNSCGAVNEQKTFCSHQCSPELGCSHQNFDFPKKSAFIAHLKALNKSFLEWACFLNLDKRFMRYSNFCICKIGVF